uniref:Ig-like domain-containing protein n=1 Tax=Sinocyclocheilus grahami TaxID=75366 RepID=A0A672PZM7_SINGR
MPKVGQSLILSLTNMRFVLDTTHLSGFEEVICFCGDVYPAPRVNLFIEPAGLPDSLQPFTRKTADKQGLYSVQSKLKKFNNLTHICLVQSFYRSQTWRASLVEGHDFIISCVAPSNFTLTWSFTKEHKSSTIYTYDSLTQRSSSGDGSLQLRNPLRLEHTGTYTCILSAHQTKHEVHRRVHITWTKHEDHRRDYLIKILLLIIIHFIIFMKIYHFMVYHCCCFIKGPFLLCCTFYDAT